MLMFEVIDISSRKIHLSRERWMHIISEHPLLFNKIEEIKDTLIKPLSVRESLYNPKVRFYYRYCKNIHQKEKFLMIVVKYLNGVGFIVTSFYVNKIKGEYNGR